MKVIRAKISGFCMGVRRAVNLAMEAASVSGNVYTLGPLIHNRKVLDDLRQLDIKILDENEIQDIPKGSTVIIRAHGISPETENRLVKQGVVIIDATCPHVKTSQKKAEYYAHNGCIVFLAGEKDHAEITGIRGYIKSAAGSGSARQISTDNCIVAGDSGEAARAASDLYKKEPKAKTVLIGQTTISVEEYKNIGESIRKYFPDLEIIDTICSSTAERQKSLRELCGIADAVIIAGSRESANTGRLLALASGLGRPCALIDSADEIPPLFYTYKTIGLAAGASVPESLMDEIEKKLTKKINF